MIFKGEKKVLPFFSLISLILLFGCSSLPDYGQPRTYPGDTKLPGLVVPYRDLVVDDFQAKSLPEYLHGHSRDLNAHTAVAIRTVAGAQYTLSPPDGDKIRLYSGRVSNLAFEAVMIPDHSWWNPSLAKEKFAYVLQHEQIHFALMEAAALRLTERVKQEQAQLMVFDTSKEAVKKRLMEKIDRMLAESEKDVLSKHTDFDKETSRRYAPAVQQKWYEKVERELVELSGLK